MSSATAIPYIGSKICLVTNADIRYEGILFNINTVDSTVGLTSVRCFGTEGRKMGGPEVPANDRIFEYILFKGKDIKEITVSEPAPPDDPAIVAINPSPPQQTTTTTSQGAGNLGGDSQMMHPHGMTDPQVSKLGDQNGFYLMNQRAPPTSRMIGNGAGGMSHYGSHRSGHMYSSMGGGRNFDYVGPLGPTGGRRGGQYMPHMGGGMYLVPGRKGGYGGHRSGRGGGYNNSTRIIGELDAQPNQTLQSLVGQAFNFEEANSKFDKSSLVQEAAAAAAATEGKENNQDGSDGTTTTVLPVIKSVYDKNSSFFDNISCETLDRQKGADVKIDRAKQKQLDVETFGQAAAQSRPGRSGGRMSRRGRSGMGGYRRQANSAGFMGSVPHHIGMGGYQLMSGGGFHYAQGRY